MWSWKNRARVFGPALSISVLIFLFCFCAKPADKVIRDLLNQMKLEAESGQWDEFMSHISRNYKDHNGNTYLTISYMVRNHTKGVTNLSVELEVMGVSVSEDRAEAQLKLKARGEKGGGVHYVVGTGDSAEYPKVSFAKEGLHWKLVRVEGIRGNEDSPW